MQKHRKLAAIMFTDIVGYTALMSKNEENALRILQKNRDVIKLLVGQFNGELLKEIGDGNLCSFPSVVDAVNCALEIQNSLRDEIEFKLRIGIHVGDVVVEEGGDVFGDGVNVASRIENLAEPGGICISERVYHDIRNKPDIEAVYLGEKKLKNVGYPIKVYALKGEGLAAGFKIPVIDKIRFTEFFQFYKKLYIALPIFLLIIIFGIIVTIWFKHNAKIRWIKDYAIPEIERLAEKENWNEAISLARQVEDYSPTDSMFIKLWPRFSKTFVIESDPLGAKVYRKDYTAVDEDWEYLGQTPVDSTRIAHGLIKLKLVKGGFRTLYAATRSRKWKDIEFIKLKYQLDKEESIPNDMVKVPSRLHSFSLPGLSHLEAVHCDGYLIDKYEVTNKAFKQFVDSGGYEKREFWKNPFELDGRIISFEVAIDRFKDKTNRPGPSTWEAGGYPDDQDNYPVTGISWYEAAAYAEFAGKSLPTIYHWDNAASVYLSSYIIPLSNFNKDGPAPVGSYKGMSQYGTYDMAGNVREWCWNTSGNNRFISGGGWDDQIYMFSIAYSQPPFDRSPANGFRCIKYPGKDKNVSVLKSSIEFPERDFLNEKPVNDEVFAIYKSMYSYDKSELNAVIESKEDTNENWTLEKISYNAAYGNERIPAYLFLPKTGEPPYQTIIFFPGSQAVYDRSLESLMLSINLFDYFLKDGRAFMLPAYNGTFERSGGLKSHKPNSTNMYKEYVIHWAKDIGRSIDYLETRTDIDTDKLVYYGLSWGGAMGGIMPAVETRFKVIVLHVAGIYYQKTLPEVNAINFIPRITIPVLMLNGRYDHSFQLETSQIPMYQLLGTPSEHKRHFIYETGHSVPRPHLIRETLDWLDQYLGVVN